MPPANEPVFACDFLLGLPETVRTAVAIGVGFEKKLTAEQQSTVQKIVTDLQQRLDDNPTTDGRERLTWIYNVAFHITHEL